MSARPNNGRAREAEPLYAHAMRRRDKWALEGAARTARRMLADRPSMRMVRVTFVDADAVLIYADAERAAELMEAYEVVRKRHAASPAPADVTPKSGFGI